MSQKPSVLFVCLHNAGRSQMAAAFLTTPAQGTIEVRSAGSQPAEKVNPAHYQQRRQIQEGVNTATVEAWATKLPPDEIALVDRVARRWMKRYGYAPSPAAGKAHPLEVARAVRLHRGYGRRLMGRRLVDARRARLRRSPRFRRSRPRAPPRRETDRRYTRQRQRRAPGRYPPRTP